MVEEWNWMFHNAIMPLMFLFSLSFLLLPSCLNPEHAVHTVFHILPLSHEYYAECRHLCHLDYVSAPFLYGIIFFERVVLSCGAADRFAANYIHSIPQSQLCGACSWGARRQTAMEHPCRAHLLSQENKKDTFRGLAQPWMHEWMALCNTRPSHLVQQKSFCKKPDRDQNCKTRQN